VSEGEKNIGEQEKPTAGITKNPPSGGKGALFRNTPSRAQKKKGGREGVNFQQRGEGGVVHNKKDGAIRKRPDVISGRAHSGNGGKH